MMQLAPYCLNVLKRDENVKHIKKQIVDFLKKSQKIMSKMLFLPTFHTVVAYHFS